MALKDLKAAALSELATAKSQSSAELRALGESGRVLVVSAGGSAYDLNTWSEPVPGDETGAFAVLVGVWRRSHVGSIKQQLTGFVVRADGTKIDIDDSDLWRYD